MINYEKCINTLPFLLVFLTGILLLIISIIEIKNEKKKSVLKKYIKNTRKSDNFFDNWLDSQEFITKLEEKNEIKFALLSNIITPRRLTKLTIYSISGGILFSLLLQNILALPLSLGICYYIPTLYLDLLVKNKKGKIEGQLGVAIKFFTTEFTTTKSVIVALQNIIPKLPSPIKNEFERLAREINSGTPPKECLLNFSKRLDNKFAYVFSKLLISYFNDGTEFGEHLVRLSQDISTAQIQHKEIRSELSMVRTTNFILNGVVLFSILIIFVLIPNKSIYFKSSTTGQSLMTLVIFNSFISMYLGFRLENK